MNRVAAAETADMLADAKVLPVRQEQLKERLGERFRELDVPLLVEWPDRGGSLLPAADLVLHFFEQGDLRNIRCEPVSAAGAALAERTA